MSYYTPRIVNLLFIVLLEAVSNPVLAADPNPVAEPPVPTYQYPFSDDQTAQNLQTNLTVVELFSSFDCLFCTDAEHLIADLNTKSAAIVLACHTDKEDPTHPLAREFCTARQERYGAKLSDGLLYTPQMIINGHIDAVGHEFAAVRVGLNTALNDKIVRLTPRVSDQPDNILIDLPNLKLPTKGRTDLFAIMYRPPYAVPNTMRQAGTRTAPLARVATRFIPLGGWDGAHKTLNIPFTADDDTAGFVVMVQDEHNNIIAAGEWPLKTPE